MFSSTTPFGRHTVSPLWDCRIAGEFRIVNVESIWFWPLRLVLREGRADGGAGGLAAECLKGWRGGLMI